MTTFRFESPLALLLLLVVFILAIMPRLNKRRAQPATLRYADTTLTAGLARPWRLTLRPILRLLRLLALVLAIIALARPQTGQTQEIIRGQGVDIVLAVDISGSMATLDFRPQNRLEAAKDVISDFIDARSFDRLGLVVFASTAFNQSPLTIDHDVLQRLLNQVELATDLGVADGTAIGLGLANAASMLRDSASSSRVVILLTDGVNNSGEIDPLTAAQAAKALGIKVYTIGAGQPGEVSVVQFDPLLGERVVTQENMLDEDTLRRIAEITGGEYFRATDADGLELIYEQINELEKSEIEIRSFSRFTELAHLILMPALISLLLEMILRQTVFRKIP